MPTILQKKLDYTKKCKVFTKKKPIHYNVFALFLLTESLLHMAERKW